MRCYALGIAAAVIALSLAGPHAAERGGWVADAKGCRVWRQHPRATLTLSWSGPCVRGVAAGHGVLEWYEDGRREGRYEGDLKAGHYDGHGAYGWANGDRYWGELSNDAESGHGFFAWASGDRYDGEWRQGLRSGQGVYLWADGSRYEGGWKDGRAEGRGTYRQAGGESYTGSWAAGCFREGTRRAWVGTAADKCK